MNKVTYLAPDIYLYQLINVANLLYIFFSIDY